MAEIIVVFGATGVVGLGIVKYFLSTRDITVIAPVRGDPQKLLT
jgi:thioester reductase-like protein